MSAIPENDLLMYINQARTNPTHFARHIQKQLDTFVEEKAYPLFPGCNCTVNEGKSAWKEAIKYLRQFKPIEPFFLHEGLRQAAEDHAIDIAKTNSLSLTGSDGSSQTQRIERRCGKMVGSLSGTVGSTFNFPQLNHALETVMSLLINDGVPTRANRDQLLSTTYKYLGISSRKNEDSNMIYTVIVLTSQNMPTLNSQPKRTEEKKGETQGEKDKKETKGDPNFQGNKLSVIPDLEILKYTNEARTNPKKFAEYVKKQFGQFIDEKSLPLVPGCNYSTNEGKSVWLQTIKFLEEQNPLPPLQINQGLSLTAEDHVIDIVKKKFFGHSGSDGSQPRDRIDRRCGKSYGSSGENISSQFSEAGRNHALESILSLIIDDGVPSRGHRTNIFSNGFRFMGCASRINHQKKIVTVINYHYNDLPLKNGKLNTDNAGSSLPYKVDPNGKVVNENSKADPNFKGNKLSVISDLEVLKYTNEARTNPKKFAQYVKKQLTEFIDEILLPLKPGLNYRTNQGKTVWRQTIKFLEQQKALPPLELNQGLSYTAEDHVVDLVKNKMFGHPGSDGSQPRDRIDRRCGKSYGSSGENISSEFSEGGRNHALQSILSLIIDDGVKSRGHRTNIFSNDFRFMGCASRLNHQKKIVTVINYHSLDIPLINDKPNKDSIGSSLPQTIQVVDKRDPFFRGNKMSVISDLDVLKYTNEARTNPQKFCQHIKKQLQSFIDENVFTWDIDFNMRSHQGKSAWKQAIKFLEDQKPLPPLELNHGLSLTAEDHVIDLVKTKLEAHTGSDGSQPRDRIDRRCGKSFGYEAENVDCEFYVPGGRNHALKIIIILIIDDGIKSRGHRKTIFSPDIKFLGCASRVNHQNKILTVINHHSLDLPLINDTPNTNPIGSTLPSNQLQAPKQTPNKISSKSFAPQNPNPYIPSNNDHSFDSKKIFHNPTGNYGGRMAQNGANLMNYGVIQMPSNKNKIGQNQSLPPLSQKNPTAFGTPSKGVGKIPNGYNKSKGKINPTHPMDTLQEMLNGEVNGFF